MKLSVSAYRAQASAHKKILCNYQHQLSYGATSQASSARTHSDPAAILSGLKVPFAPNTFFQFLLLIVCVCVCFFSFSFFEFTHPLLSAVLVELLHYADLCVIQPSVCAIILYWLFLNAQLGDLSFLNADFF